MGGISYLDRMPLGIPGAVTRPRDLTIQPETFDPKKLFSAYGLVGKYSNGKFVPLEEGDTVDEVKGILVRPYPTQSQTDLAYLGVKVGSAADNLKRGYICVAVGVSAASVSASKGNPVYVRVAGATADSPVGSFVLVQDVTGENTPALPGAEVMGPSDANGNIEIAYNI
ncbi:structural cement protein Gp24 [Photorhabdus viridis]|uniref:structural cement protein Gp24 n=1 Tax=Photorhabdus viridis TaxID=3163327 RepID=UPI003306F8F6